MSAGARFSYNMSPGGPRYAPERDFAYNYKVLVASVTLSFDREYWPESYAQYIADCASDGLSEDEAYTHLEQVRDAFCLFLARSCDDCNETVEGTLERSGWSNTSVRARREWLARLGLVMTGQMWSGLRDVTMLGDKPNLPTEISKIAEETERLINSGHELRRVENKLTLKNDALTALRSAVRKARESGLSFFEIGEAVDDVKFGRTGT